jgi:hypothetical protein
MQSQHNIIDGDTTHIFLQKHLLHWLEVMSLMRESSRCVHLLDSLQAQTGVGFIHNSSYAVLTCNIAVCKHCSKFLHDAKRFVLRSQSVLADAPLQTYCSALVFGTREESSTTNFCGPSAREG